MRVGIYNLHWHTFGGGEQQAGGVVDALAADHEVEVLGPRRFDFDVARARLGVSFDNVTFRQISNDELENCLATADYDLFVNHTYRSTMPSLAPRSIYFVMFPHRPELSRQQRIAALAGRSPERSVRLLGRVARFGAHVVIERTASVQVPLATRSIGLRLRSEVPTVVRIAPVARGVTPVVHQVFGDAFIEVPMPVGHHGSLIVSPSTGFDEREPTSLLYLEHLAVDGRTVGHDPASLVQRLVPVRTTTFLDSYDRVVALSAYTRRWTNEWWGRGEDVISPPVRLRSAVPVERKEKVIVCIGRFFGPESGHSKRQLELVAAFRTLVEQGLEGWRLILIGGARPEDRDYAMAVRSAARGLPVEVRFSAPSSVVDESLAVASICWHGAGFGSDLDAAPERAEHFGIAPVEAMSTGAVPVVFGAAGPAEVVQHGVSGLHWSTIDELISHTRRLIDEPTLRERLAAAAIERAREFDEAHFHDHVRTLVHHVVDGAPQVALGSR